MITRRTTLMLLSATSLVPTSALAATPKVVEWADLIPKGVPYAEVTGLGEFNDETGSWNPIFDENATKLNEDLNGVFVKIPGFIVPLEIGSAGVSDFLLVPYVGACIHSPPPPANQLVLAKTKKPWPSESLWDPVWIYGTLRTKLETTDLGQSGYSIVAETMEVYEW